MVKSRVLVVLLIAGVLLALAAAPAAAHGGGSQTKTSEGYRLYFATNPGEPTVESSTKLQFSVHCANDGKPAHGSIRVEVTEGENKAIEREMALHQDTVELSHTFPSAGARKVKLFFEPDDPTACPESSGKEAKAEFNLNIEEKSFLPAPALPLALLALAAPAILLALRKRDS